MKLKSEDELIIQRWQSKAGSFKKLNDSAVKDKQQMEFATVPFKRYGYKPKFELKDEYIVYPPSYNSSFDDSSEESNCVAKNVDQYQTGRYKKYTFNTYPPKAYYPGYAAAKPSFIQPNTISQSKAGNYYLEQVVINTTPSRPDSEPRSDYLYNETPRPQAPPPTPAGGLQNILTTPYVPLRRYRQNMVLEKDYVVLDAPLTYADEVVRVAELIGLDPKLMRYALNLRQELQRYQPQTSELPPALRMYVYKSVTRDFYYSSGKAGDRPEIAVFKFKGNIGDEAVAYVYQATELLNKHAKRDIDQLVIYLISFTVRGGEDSAALICDRFDIVLIEVFEKACIELKFVDLYARVLIKYVDQIATNSKFKAAASYALNGESFTDPQVNLRVYARELLIKQRINYELVEHRPVDPRYANCRDQELLAVHFRLSVRFFSQLCVISAGKFVSVWTCASMLDRLAQGIAQQAINSVDAAQTSADAQIQTAYPVQTVLTKAEYQSESGFQRCLAAIANAPPAALQHSLNVWGLVDGVESSLAFLALRCGQSRDSSMLADAKTAGSSQTAPGVYRDWNFLDRVQRVINCLVQNGKLLGVQSYKLRHAASGGADQYESAESAKKAPRFINSGASASAAAKPSLTPLDAKTTQDWILDSKDFEQICCDITRYSDPDALIALLRDDAVYNYFLEAVKPLATVALVKHRVDTLTRQSQRILRAAGRYGLYTAFYEEMLKKARWEADEATKRGFYMQIASGIARTLVGRQLHFRVVLELESERELLLLIVYYVVQFCYFEAADDAEEDDSDESDLSVGLQMLRERCAKHYFAGLHEIPQLAALLAADLAAEYGADAARALISASDAVVNAQAEHGQAVCDGQVAISNQDQVECKETANEEAKGELVHHVQEAQEDQKAQEGYEAYYAYETQDIYEIYEVPNAQNASNRHNYQIVPVFALLLNRFERRAVAELRFQFDSLRQDEKERFIDAIKLYESRATRLDALAQFFRDAGFPEGVQIVQKQQLTPGPKFCEAAAASTATSTTAPEYMETVFHYIQGIGYQLPAKFYFNAARQMPAPDAAKTAFLERFAPLFDAHEFAETYERAKQFLRGAQLGWAEDFVAPHCD